MTDEKRAYTSCKKDAVKLMADLGLECPPDFDPKRSCIACQMKFDNLIYMNVHVQKCHPELYDHFRSILESWSNSCK